MMNFFSVRSALVIALTVGVLSGCIDSAYAEETEGQKILSFLGQLEQDNKQYTANMESSDSPTSWLDLSGIDQDRLKEYQQFCITNQIFSVAYPIQFQKLKNVLISRAGEKGAAMLADMGWESERVRDKACILAYAQLLTEPDNDATLGGLIENTDFDGILKWVKNRRDLFKKFQGVPLAKKEGSAFGVVLRATEKAFVENLTKLEQMSRLGKLNASKNK